MTRLLRGIADLRTVAFLLLALLAERAMQIGFAPGLADPDYPWHLETGELIAGSGSLPAGDPFSWTFAGEPWVLHEWLFQVLLYGVYESAGEPGVLLMVSLLGGAGLFAAFLLADRWIRRPVLTLLLTLVACPVFLGFLTPRPHLVSYLFFGLQLLLLWRARYDARLGGLAVIPPMMLFWVNLHGGYFIGLAFLLAFAATETLRLSLGAGSEQARPRRYLPALWLAFAAALLASMANPDGPAHLLYPFRVMTLEATGIISEWVTLNFQAPRNLWFLAVALSFAALFALRRTGPDLTELALPLVTLAAGIASARNAPYAEIVMLAYAGRAIGDGAFEPLRRRMSSVRSGESGKGEPPAAESQILHPGLQAALNAALAGLLALLLAVSTLQQAYFEKIEELRPKDVIAFIEQNKLEGRMMNEYTLGGALIRAFHPQRKVFIDGRADLYGDDFVLANHWAVKRGENWREHVDGWEIDYAVVLRRDAIGKLLFQAPDFALVFEGELYDVYARRGGLNESVIAEREILIPRKTAPDH